VSVRKGAKQTIDGGVAQASATRTAKTNRWSRWVPWRSANLRRARAVTFVAGLVGLVLNAIPSGREVEERLGNFALFQLRGPLLPPQCVMVVSLDSASRERLGVGFGRLPRLLHARAIRRLARHGASVIAFDVMFSTPEPGEDEALASEIRASGRVILLEGLERNITEEKTGSYIEMDRPVGLVPALAEAASASARFPLPKVPARVDGFWTFHGSAGFPTMPAVALQVGSRDIATLWAELLASDPELPKLDPAVWSGPEIIIAMQALHNAMRKSDGAADRLRAALVSRYISDNDKHRLSALIGLYSEEDARYLNLRGPAGTIRTINYAALLADMPDEEIGDLSGKVVFIGVSELQSATQPDAYNTVFSRWNGIELSGVEIAANAYADLAEQMSPRRPVLSTVIIFLTVALVLGIVASTGRMLVLLAGSMGIALILIAVSWWSFMERAWLLSFINPIIFQVPAGILTAAWCLRTEERNRRIRMGFAARQYLPEEVVQRLNLGPLHRSDRLAGETRFTVCLATDIEGFTTLSERLEPEVVRELLNEYFHEIFAVVQSHRGEVSQIVGDGVMCSWTSMVRSPSACIGAMDAALDLLEAVARFNQVHVSYTLPTRVGIHAGSALVGVVGGAGRYASTIVGDVANTASRIEGLNKHLGTRLLASGEAVAQNSEFVYREMGEFLLAGKSTPIRIVEVLGRDKDTSAHKLASCFAQGFSAFRSSRWEEAALLFEAVLKNYPGDGPSQYFLQRALKAREIPNGAADLLVSRIDQK
jgi:adenylate cyclase